MADQPYYRPYEPTEFFAGRPVDPAAANAGVDPPRPVARERPARHRADPRGVGPASTTAPGEHTARRSTVELTPEPIEDRDDRLRCAAVRPADRRRNPKVYVDEFPFAITEDDLKRGQERYTIYCAVCHGPLGNGQGRSGSAAT